MTVSLVQVLEFEAYSTQSSLLKWPNFVLKPTMFSFHFPLCGFCKRLYHLAETLYWTELDDLSLAPSAFQYILANSHYHKTTKCYVLC